MMEDDRVTIEPGWKLPSVDVDLILITIYTLIAVASIYLPIVSDTPLRSALGLGMVLFMPGYALIAALFPGRKDIDGIERTALSFGLSIAVAPLIGLALNFTSWGIRFDPIVVCLALFTLICSAAANYRRHELKSEDRFSIDFEKAWKDARAELFPSGESRLDRTLTVILLLSIIASIAVLAFVIAVPKQGEKFTEFYILGPNGKADNYPEWFRLGDSKPVTVGVINHEYRNMTYDLVVALNDSNSVTQLYSERLELADNQTWERTVSLTPDRIGTNMEIEFLLYADGNMTAPYRDLHLWVNVTKPA
jgi:Predicted membrane protein